MNKLKLII